MQSGLLSNLIKVGTSYLPGGNAIPYGVGAATAAYNALPTIAKAVNNAAPIPSPTPVAPALPPVIRPPKLDYAAVQSQARASAEGAVNPYYTKQLNDFLAQQSAQKQQKQTEYDTSIQNLQDQLKNTIEGNQISQTRTAEDVAQKQADINQGADQFQTDTGQAFDANRIAQARQLAAGGDIGGLDAQQQEGAQLQRNTAEKRQEQQFQQQRNAQELFKTRTFEDLARSGDLATQAEAKGEKAAQFDLNSYMQNAGFAEQNKRGELEAQRLQAVAAEQQNQAKLAYQRYLANIRDPAQLAMASQIYGGAF